MIEQVNQLLTVEQGQIAEYGDRGSLASNSKSRFTQLLQAGSVVEAPKAKFNGSSILRDILD